VAFCGKTHAFFEKKEIGCLRGVLDTGLQQVFLMAMVASLAAFKFVSRIGFSRI
jgi:energy-converting hydrogenase A subunit M